MKNNIKNQSRFVQNPSKIDPRNDPRSMKIRPWNVFGAKSRPGWFQDARGSSGDYVGLWPLLFWSWGLCSFGRLAFGLLVFRFFGLLAFGLLVFGSFGPLVFWPLIFWSFGLMASGLYVGLCGCVFCLLYCWFADFVVWDFGRPRARPEKKERRNSWISDDLTRLWARGPAYFYDHF